jgi:hypothetical protein
MKQSTKIMLIVGAVLVLGVAVYLGVMKNKTGDESGSMNNPGGSGTPQRSTETTAASGSYVCQGGKTFTLSVRSDGTARVTGASSANVVLKKSTAGIWISDDSRVAVREIAGYTVLVENDVTTRDRCTLKK